MSRLPGPHSVELAALHPVMGTPGDPQFVPHFISPTGLNPQRVTTAFGTYKYAEFWRFEGHQQRPDGVPA